MLPFGPVLFSLLIGAGMLAPVIVGILIAEILDHRSNRS